MRAVVPLDARLIHELQIRFVHEACRVECVTGSLAPHLPVGDPAQLFVNKGEQPVHGVGFAGVKGFAGGFGRRQLGAWGEKIIKDFVHEAIEEALKLEKALLRLRTPQKIAVLHYSPVHQTVQGEPEEIVAFLGSSRLEEPIDRYRCTAVFHGHAHRGSLQGETKTKIPVYNVAMPLLLASNPGQPAFRVVEVPVGEPALTS